VQNNPASIVEVSLPKQTITLQATASSESFEINTYKKECLLNGYDDIDYLLSIKKDIEVFESQRN
jgi:3-isopropylmalate/(R)-2-methylmalate dehydratase small subunit